MFLALTLLAALAQATSPAPVRAEPPAAAEARSPNRVLVLGTPHLSGWPDDVPLANLAPLLDRLTAWAPEIIAIESVPGADCWLMRRQPRFVDAVADYCVDTAPARAATGLDVPEALAERERLLGDWPARPAPSARRRLAALDLAAGDPASAVVQWLSLPESERHAGDGLDAALVADLTKRAARRNENYAIAAVLAARLGLNGVVQMDHQAVAMRIDDEQAYGAAVGAAWKAAALAATPAEAAAEGPGLRTPQGVLDAYRLFNAPEQAPRIYARDFGAALADPSPGQYGRMYVTYWETRNLRMAANIREAMGPVPGRRMLVIVGASHKAYLERYLGEMRDVQIVDAQAVLR